MNKEKALQAIKNYRNYYTDLAHKINTIRADRTHTEKWKSEQIAKLTNDYYANHLTYKDAIRTSVEDIKTGIKTKRQEEIKRGLEASEAVNMIITGINNNAYSPDMLTDVLSVYADNPVALSTIRGALIASSNEDIKMIATHIPQTNNDRVMKNLDKITDALEFIPSVEADGLKDWNAGLYQDGTSFDGWTNYIDENITE